MNVRLSFWQATFLLLLLMRCALGMSVTWAQVLAPLAVHYGIRLEAQVRQMRAGARLPITWFLQ